MQPDTILKKYSSTVATIFTGIASAALFGHTLTMNFILGISIVFISMHQVSEIVICNVFGVDMDMKELYYLVRFCSIFILR